MSLAKLESYVKSHLGTIGIGASAAVIGGGLGIIAAHERSKHSNSKRRKRKVSASRKRYSNSKHHKKQRYTPHTAGKRRDTSRRRIRYTKKGQPYVIQSNGRARFIKKSSAHSSHKRHGGRY